jgi:hypothetical protein
VLVAAGVAEAVPEEVHGAALPGTAEHLRDRRLEPLVGVGDDELHAAQAARDERACDLAPEGLGLGGADVDAEGVRVGPEPVGGGVRAGAQAYLGPRPLWGRRRDG